MLSSCRCGSGSLCVPVGQTSLLYKEAPELPRRPWREHPPDAPEFFRHAPGAATRNLPAAEEVSG
jgi:hypothetical protein